MKYSRSQLREVKKALREQNEIFQLEEEEDSVEEKPVTLSEARAMARSMRTDAELQKKSDDIAAKRALRREVIETQEVVVDWKVNVGDAVMFEMNGDTQFGIIVEYRPGVAANKRNAMRSGGVKVMSSAGQYWVKPSSLTKIDE